MPFSVIEGVRGRREDVVWLDGPSGRVGVQPGVFGEVLESREVTGWQVTQESRSRARTRIVPAPGFDQGGPQAEACQGVGKDRR